MDGLTRDLITEAIRILFLLGLPVVLFGAFAGSLIGAFQSATSIQDTALRYAARLLAAILVLYFLAPAAGRYLMQLAELALSAR